jgi:hypothetical protein
MANQSDKTYYDQNDKLIIKPYRLVDLSQIFDVNPKTFKRWLKNIEKEIGKPEGRFYSVNQVEYMIAQFGLPRKLDTSLLEEELRKVA